MTTQTPTPWYANGNRIYVNDSISAKGKVGGFAVSGRTPTKGYSNDYLHVTADSTRIFTRDTISGFSIKDNREGKLLSYMKLTPINYFIGHNAGKNNTTGRFNSIIGYESAFNNTEGSDNVFFGYQCGYSNKLGLNNIFIGKTSELFYSVNDLEGGVDYSFMVRGYDEAGNLSESSKPVKISTKPTGIGDNNSIDLKFLITTIPVTNNLLIKSNVSGLIRVTIYDIQGKLVVVDTFSDRIVINRNRLEGKGAYIIRMVSADLVYTRKFIVE